MRAAERRDGHGRREDGHTLDSYVYGRGEDVLQITQEVTAHDDNTERLPVRSRF